MTNLEVARILDHIADLLQIKEENPFKIRAYRKAAQAIYRLDQDLYQLHQEKRLDEIPGVGKTVQAKIIEMLETGTLMYYEGLVKEIPETVLDLLTVPGIGPKTVKLIYHQLGISNLPDLQQAAREQRLRQLPGLGPKTEETILRGIELLHQGAGKFPIGAALPAAQALCAYLQDHLNAQICMVGSLRRGKPLVSDVDILIATSHPAAVHQVISQYRAASSVTSEAQDHIAGVLSGNIPFEIIIVSPEEFYYRLVRATGSKSHRARLFDGSQGVDLSNLTNEEDLYHRLGLMYIPPELREDRGEIEAARLRQIPVLIKQPDIRGDLHIHSDWSDGSNKITELAAAAGKLGYQYIAITDHTRSLAVTGGLDGPFLLLQGQVIDQLNQEQKMIRVLKGIEVDILKDGRLDMEDDILADLDIVVASIHSHFHLNMQEQTQRLLKAIANPHVDIIGHLTGRLLNRRAGYDLDLDRILEAAARHHKVLEINAHPDRLDIDEETARQAREYGIKIAINSDAHHFSEFALMRYGVLVARRGWLTADDVINTWPVENMLSYFNRA